MDPQNRQTPWGSDDASRSDMARDAGLGDIGNSGRGETQRDGLFDDDNRDTDDDGDDDFDVADSGDFGGDGGSDV